ncbi:hypothetical protein [Dactylosporangium sp. NPDC000521]
MAVLVVAVLLVVLAGLSWLHGMPVVVVVVCSVVATGLLSAAIR